MGMFWVLKLVVVVVVVVVMHEWLLLARVFRSSSLMGMFGCLLVVVVVVVVVVHEWLLLARYNSFIHNGIEIEKTLFAFQTCLN
jgi:hypothetical protein